MRKYFERFNKRKLFFAYAVLAVIAVFFALSGAWVLGGGFALAIALPALTDAETEFLATVKGELNKELEKFQKGYISKAKMEEFVEAKLKEVQEAGISKKEFESLQGSVEKMGLTIKRLEKGESDKPKTILEQLEAQKDGIVYLTKENQF